MRTSNAGTKIILRASNRHGEQVTISVEDDGPGMSHNVREHCLEPKFTTDAQRGSMGLGLSLVKAFVEGAGGEIEVFSPPPAKPRGTAISMRFPVRSSSPLIHVTPSESSARQGAYTS